jgi:hypothetical protein
MFVAMLLMVVIVMIIVVIFIMLPVLLFMMFLFPVLMTVAVTMSANSTASQGQQSTVGRRLQKNLPSLGRKVTFIENAAVHQILVHEIPTVKVLGRLEPEGIEKLAATHGNIVGDLKVKKRFLQFSFPDVLFRLETDAGDQSRHDIVPIDPDIDFDCLDTQIVERIMLGAGEILRTAPRLKQTSGSEKVELREKKPADVGALPHDGVDTSGVVFKHFFFLIGENEGAAGKEKNRRDVVEKAEWIHFNAKHLQ